MRDFWKESIIRKAESNFFPVHGNSGGLRALQKAVGVDVDLDAGRAADADAADRSYVGLAKQICDLIAAGDVGPRARLPSERTLAERFGVSRTQVREAIIALEVQGVVEVRVGSGIYVAEAPEARSVTFELPRGPGPIETLRARVVIESEIAALAAIERKDSDLDRLFAALRAMREVNGVLNATVFGQSMHLLVDESVRRAEIDEKLRSVGIASPQIHEIGPSLEDVFVTLTAKHAGENHQEKAA